MLHRLREDVAVEVVLHDMGLPPQQLVQTLHHLAIPQIQQVQREHLIVEKVRAGGLSGGRGVCRRNPRGGPENARWALGGGDRR